MFQAFQQFCVDAKNLHVQSMEIVKGTVRKSSSFSYTYTVYSNFIISIFQYLAEKDLYNNCKCSNCHDVFSVQNAIDGKFDNLRIYKYIKYYGILIALYISIN